MRIVIITQWSTRPAKTARRVVYYIFQTGNSNWKVADQCCPGINGKFSVRIHLSEFKFCWVILNHYKCIWLNETRKWKWMLLKCLTSYCGIVELPLVFQTCRLLSDTRDFLDDRDTVHQSLHELIKMRQERKTFHSDLINIWRWLIDKIKLISWLSIYLSICEEFHQI